MLNENLEIIPSRNFRLIELFAVPVNLAYVVGKSLVQLLNDIDEVIYK